MLHLIAKFIFWIIGWTPIGNLPSEKKYLIIGGPHTSNWDFILFLMLKFYTGLKVNFIGKHTIFRWPFGYLLRALGGIPVVRHKTSNTVSQIAQLYKDKDEFYLAMAPMGTRSYTDKWKSGFYHIAREANVPLLLGFICYKTKRIGFDHLYTLTGDIKKDMDHIRGFLDPFVGRHPEKKSKIILKEELPQDNA